MKIPGHKENSPIGKYIGLRKRTAMEKLCKVSIVISVGTTFEACKLEKILMFREYFEGDAIDFWRIITGYSGGQFQDEKLHTHTEHYYKTGGMAGIANMERSTKKTRLVSSVSSLIILISILERNQHLSAFRI